MCCYVSGIFIVKFLLPLVLPWSLLKIQVEDLIMSLNIRMALIHTMWGKVKIKEAMKYVSEGHTWGYFVLEPGSGAGLVDFASSSLLVLFRCWLHREAISPLRPFSDIRKHKDVLNQSIISKISGFFEILRILIVDSVKRNYFFSLPCLN